MDVQALVTTEGAWRAETGGAGEPAPGAGGVPPGAARGGAPVDGDTIDPAAGARVAKGGAALVEEAAAIFLAGLGEERRAARSMAQLRRMAVRLEGERVVSKMRRHASKTLASGIWNGVVTIASSVVQAATAGAGSAGGGGGGGTKGSIAGSVTGGLLGAARSMDPFAIQAEKASVGKQEAENRRQAEEEELKLTGDSLEAIRQTRSRAVEIMARALQAQEEGARAALTAIRW